MRHDRTLAVLVVAGAATAVIAGLTPAAAAVSSSPTPAPYPTAEPAIAPAAEPGDPNTSPILISEVTNGGAGLDTNADRVSTDDFIEIGNFGTEPVDVSDWRILRCGQTGDGYGPQKVIPKGTVLQPGDKYTVGSANSTHKDVVKRDADYDATGSTLHSFGFGAYLEDPAYHVIDRVAFYADRVDSDCNNPTALQRPLDHRLSQSHQRIANTGDVEQDWAVATRTPDDANATAPQPTPTADTQVRISELANGDAVSDANQYVELTNYGDTDVDVSGWKLYRCGENSTSYVQHRGLPAGTTIPAGASFLFAHSSAALGGVTPNATYTTGMHWRDFGAMVVQPDEAIVDRVGVYADRNSICNAGTGIKVKPNNLQNQSLHRVSDTGDNAADFFLAAERTPGKASARAELSTTPAFERTDLRFSEIVGAGPGGSSDEFVELANYGTTDRDLAGYSLVRCEGTGKGNAGTQVADLGDVTLKPGQTYVAAAAAAPAELRAKANATYATGLNETDGYGMWLRAPDGTMVDAVGVYHTVTYSPCVIGSEIRNETKNDKGESYQRARTTGDNEEDFAKTADRTPGVLADVEWVDPAKPLPGETDPVTIETPHAPGTPKAEGTKNRTGYRATVTTEDADGGKQTIDVRTATTLETEGTRIFAGSTQRKLPKSLTITGERRVETAPALETTATRDTYPFQRYAVPVTEVPAGGVEFTWSGATRDRNEIQMYAWNGQEWTLVAADSPSADGDLTLVGTIAADRVLDGTANVLVIDGPRTEGGAVDAIGVTDQKFLDPEDYDLAFNHMTDTQFLSEGFRGVFRRMATWVIQNAQARKIGYSTNGGDIIENWIGGNADPVRADKEFAFAKQVHQLLNDADIPNGVLPGNHDNLWGRNNDRFNEFLGSDMYEDESWFGASWKKGDNSAHYDFFEANGIDFVALSLPYRPSQEQIDWAREVAAAYPSRNVVLITHSYLDTEKNIENRDDRYTARGEDIWRDLVAPSDNVFLVLGGHYHGVATKYGDPVTGEQVDAIDLAADTVAVRNVGETGRTVVQMLADYQGYRSTQPAGRADTLDRDTGFQRLLQFDVDAELMAVNAYSPTLESFEAYKYDEPGMRGTPENDYQDGRYKAVDDEFVAKVDLLVRKKLDTAQWGVTTASVSAGTAEVAAGEKATFALGMPQAGTFWYATVADSSERTVTSTPLEVDSAAEPGAAPTVATVKASSTRQVYGAAPAKLGVLTATVRDEETTDPVAGRVVFRSGSREVGRAALAATGQATLRLPANLAVGVHALTATYLPADATAYAGSMSTPVRVTVVKATATARARLVKSTVTRKQRAKVAVTVRTNGPVASGPVRVTVRRAGWTRVVDATVRNGAVTVRLPKLSKGRYKVAVTYRGAAGIAADAAPTRTLRVR
ncbi:lamin tail domain-containing protein [Mumia qirimensis]|uniref:lamin tail domain-containing protein n=1 Tax=Mumia qirimensis TaxID=3234852 RepID=UPI00351CE549